MINKKLLKSLVCPYHKSTLIHKNMGFADNGVVKNGELFCADCDRVVASIRHGKADFLRVLPTLYTEADSKLNARYRMITCNEFYYKRIPWGDNSVTHNLCKEVDVGWSSDRVTSCLFCDNSSNWSILINTDAIDVSLRFLSHDWSGCVSVEVNDILVKNIDLYSSDPAGHVNSHDIFINYSGNKLIRIKNAKCNPLSKGSQVFFYGMDASFVGSSNTGYLNKGNGYPAAYKWILDELPLDATVLDCSSGDRKYPDERVLSFEYMSFELPDIYGDGHCLPFADNTFDAVFSQAVMEHMRDPYLAAKEISRITKPGGLIYVESAFMQPLHGVPYHFFNTTIWGIQSIFNEENVDTKSVEWFGSMADTFDWFFDLCDGGNLTAFERSNLRQLLCKFDYNITYEQLKQIAPSVSFWGVKKGHSIWDDRLGDIGRPSFKYSGLR